VIAFVTDSEWPASKANVVTVSTGHWEVFASVDPDDVNGPFRRDVNKVGA
jgi:hypothetical protein